MTSDSTEPAPGLLPRLALALASGALAAAWVFRGVWKDARALVAEERYAELGFWRNQGAELARAADDGLSSALDVGGLVAGLALAALLAAWALPCLRTPAGLVRWLRSGLGAAVLVACWSAFVGWALFDLAQGRDARGAGWLTPTDLRLGGLALGLGLAWIALVLAFARAGAGEPGRWRAVHVRASLLFGLALLGGGYWASRGAWTPPFEPGLAKRNLLAGLVAVALWGATLWTFGLRRGLTLPALGCGLLALAHGFGPWLLERPSAEVEPAFAAARPFNVVVIGLDTVRADQTSLLAELPRGPHGEELDTTPRLRALASRGWNFRRAITQAPWTIPAFASVLTGKYPHEHGALVLDAKLQPGQVLLPEVLREAGYQTFGVVSHMFLQRYRGFAQGYDAYDEAATHVPDIHRAASSVPVTDAAIAMLERRDRERPFFLFAHYFDPHYEYLDHPAWQLADGYRGWFREQLDFENLQKHGALLGDEDRRWLFDLYQEELLFTDRHVGRLLGYLHEQGLTDDTLVVVVGDHGEAFGEHDAYYGHTTSVQDEVVHVPLVIAPPRTPKGGVDGFAPRAIDETVETRMIFGTVLEQLGVTPGPNAVGVFDPSAATRWTAEGVQGAEAQGRAYCGVFLEGTDPRHGKRFKKATLVEGRYKLNFDMTRGVLELFDLEADPGETRPLDHWEHREVLVPMRDERLIAWIQRMESTAEAVRRLAVAPGDRARLEALGYGGSADAQEDEAREGGTP